MKSWPKTKARLADIGGERQASGLTLPRVHLDDGGESVTSWMHRGSECRNCEVSGSKFGSAGKVTESES
jgi:hypothetical protein